MKSVAVKRSRTCDYLILTLKPKWSRPLWSRYPTAEQGSFPSVREYKQHLLAVNRVDFDPVNDVWARIWAVDNSPSMTRDNVYNRFDKTLKQECLYQIVEFAGKLSETS